MNADARRLLESVFALESCTIRTLSLHGSVKFPKTNEFEALSHLVGSDSGLRHFDDYGAEKKSF
jgi:hypothetical protein